MKRFAHLHLPDSDSDSEDKGRVAAKPAIREGSELQQESQTTPAHSAPVASAYSVGEGTGPQKQQQQQQQQQQQENQLEASSRSVSFRVESITTALSPGRSALAMTPKDSLPPSDPIVRASVSMRERIPAPPPLSKSPEEEVVDPEKESNSAIGEDKEVTVELETSCRHRVTKSDCGDLNVVDEPHAVTEVPAVRTVSRTTVKSISVCQSANTSTLEMPTPRSSRATKSERWPPLRGSVRCGLTADGRQTWVLVSPRLRAQPQEQQQKQQHADATQEASLTWVEKVVAPPPNHLPRRALDIVAAVRFNPGPGAAYPQRHPSPRVVPPASGNRAKSPARQEKVPRRFAVLPAPREQQKNVRCVTRHSNDITGVYEVGHDAKDRGVWALLRKWLLRKYNRVDDDSLCAERDLAAALHVRQKALVSAAESLLKVLQPALTGEAGAATSSSRPFPLPNGWRAVRSMSSALTDPLLTGTSRSMRRISELAFETDNGEDTMSFEVFSGTEVSNSGRFMVAQKERDSPAAPSGLGNEDDVAVEEVDYLKAFFHLEPLPLHDVEDASGYNGFLLGDGSAAVSGVSPPGTTLCDEPVGQRRNSVGSNITLSRQQGREAAGLYGLWCTVDPLMENMPDKSQSPITARSGQKKRPDVQAPQWCMQVCGGAAPQRYHQPVLSLESSVDCLSVTSMSTRKGVAHFEAMFFPQPPDDPLSRFSVNHVEGAGSAAAAATTAPIYSIPLTPQILSPAEAARYRRVLVQQKPQTVLRLRDEEQFVFDKHVIKDELFVLLSRVTVNTKQKYALNVIVQLLPCRRVGTGADAARDSNLSAAELIDVPLLHTDTAAAAARIVHGATLTFTAKGAFLKAYQALLWASEINITDASPASSTPRKLCDTSGASPYMTLRCFASLPKLVEGADTGVFHECCVQHVTSVLLQEPSFFKKWPYRLEDFVLDASPSSGRCRPLATAAILPLTNIALTPVVAFDEYGVVYRAVHTPSSQVFDVRVLPRHRTKLLWSDAADVRVDPDRDAAPRRVMEAALVLEYVSHMPFHNPIAAVLCDAHKYYIVHAPVFSALAENRSGSSTAAVTAACSVSPSQKQTEQQQPQPQIHHGVMTLRSFLDNVLHSPSTSLPTRWELARLLAAQLLLAIVSLHGKGVFLGPCSPKRLMVQWSPSATNGIAVSGGGSDNDGTRLETRDFHLLIPFTGVQTDAWLYERQQPGVIEYIPPRYLFRTAYHAALTEPATGGWTFGDDYWSYLCLLFELFAMNGASLVAVPLQQQLQPSMSKPRRTGREVWQLWKHLFKVPPLSSSSFSSSSCPLPHRPSGVTHVLQQYVQSRVEASILPDVEEWRILSEQQKSATRSPRTQTERTEANLNSGASGAISLTDAYAAALRFNISPFVVEPKNNGDRGSSVAAEAEAALDASPTNASMQILTHLCKTLVSISLKSTESGTDKTVRKMASVLLAHPFFLGIDFTSLFDGSHALPHAAFLCRKLRSKNVFNETNTNGDMLNRRAYSPRTGQQQQQQQSETRTVAGVQETYIPLLSLPTEYEGGGVVGVPMSNGGTTPPRSSLRNAHGRVASVYSVSELEELRRLRERVRLAVNNTSSREAVMPRTSDVQEPDQQQLQTQKQPQRGNDSLRVLTSAQVSFAERNVGAGAEGNGGAAYTPTWRRLPSQRGSVGEKYVGDRHDVGSRGLMVPLPQDLTSRCNDYTASHPGPTFVLADPLRNHKAGNRNHEERTVPVDGNAGEADERDKRYSWPEEYLQVANLQKKGSPASQPLSTPLERLSLLAEGPSSYAPKLHDPDRDKKAKEDFLVPSDSEGENRPHYGQRRVEQRRHDPRESLHSHNSYCISPHANGLVENTVRSETSGLFFTHSRRSASRSPPLLQGGTSERTGCKERADDGSVVLVPSDEEEQVLRIERMPTRSSRNSYTVSRQWHSSVSHSSSSTYKSSSRINSISMPSKSKEEEQHQFQLRDENIEWELVEDDDIEEVGKKPFLRAV